MYLITALLICFTPSIAAFPKPKNDLELSETTVSPTAIGQTVEPLPQSNPYICREMKSRMDPDGTKNTSKLNISQMKPPLQNVWKKTHLTYRIVNFTLDLPKAHVLSAIKRAFKIWSDVTPLTFKRVFKEKSDIEINFVTGDHEDNSPFTYTDDQLAHAFGPGADIGGDIHINDANNFTNTNQKYNLFLVIAHEIGHSLGLSHSCTYGDLMYASYHNTDASHFRLPQNDINAIQLLYETKFWSFLDLKLEKQGDIYEYGFPESVKSIDAAVCVGDKTYFFANEKYWRYDEGSQNMDKGFPRNIEDDFPGIPPRIRGAMFYRGGLYLFTDTTQYEFSLDTLNIKQVLSVTSWMGCKSIEMYSSNN